jgi:hypothetical protein
VPIELDYHNHGLLAAQKRQKALSLSANSPGVTKENKELSFPVLF